MYIQFEIIVFFTFNINKMFDSKISNISRLLINYVSLLGPFKSPDDVGVAMHIYEIPIEVILQDTTWLIWTITVVEISKVGTLILNQEVLAV